MRHLNPHLSQNPMNWVKAFHIIFMVTWFAGLFYLPRLFIYHAQAEDDFSKQRFTTMEIRLFSIMTIGAVLTWVFGLWLLLGWLSVYLSAGWMHLKLALVIGLSAYHGYCWLMIQKLKTDHTRYGQTWLRWFNEIPAFFLITIVLLVIVRF